jgi:hypothetical protein
MARPSRTEEILLAEALVALRKASSCSSLPGSSRRALEATAELLDKKYVSRTVLEAVESPEREE